MTRAPTSPNAVIDERIRALLYQQKAMLALVATILSVKKSKR